MSKVSYQTILDGITDSCSLTQPLASTARSLPSRAPRVQNNVPVEAVPTEATGSATGSAIDTTQVLDNIVITNSTLTGTVSIDLKKYQDAVSAISLPASRDIVLQSTLSPQKSKPSVDSLLGIDASGNTVYSSGVLGSALLNSSRIIINAKQQYAMLFGEKGVVIASPNRVNIDAGESITLASYGDSNDPKSPNGGLFLGLPNRGLRYVTETQAQIGVTKGDRTPDQAYEPLILGLKLANWIEDFLIVLKNAVGVDALSGVKFQPSTQAEFALLANRIPEILSNYAYVDGISHGSVDMAQIEAIKTSLAATPNYVPPESFTGTITGTVTIPNTSNDTVDYTGPGLDPAKNLIAGHESLGDYDIYNYGASGGSGIKTTTPGSPYLKAGAIKLTDKTVTQVLALQSGPENLFAVGKYQTIPTTLRGVATRLNLLNATFDQTTQEKIGVSLLLDSRPPLGAYLKGTNAGSKADLENAVQSLGQEFASLPIIKKDGVTHGDVVTGVGNKAYYGGSGPNPDNVKTSIATVVNVLIKSRTQYSEKPPSFTPSYYVP